MPEMFILGEVVLVLGVCLIVAYALHKVRVPTVVAFLLTGIVVGPGVLNLIRDIKTIEFMAQIGLVFLLFSIGLRFSLEELWKLRWLVLGAGSLQVVLTIGATTLLAKLWGLPLPVTIFMGLLVAQSSTAIMLRLIDERGETNTPHGKLMLSVAIFQDLAVIPLMLLVPLLGKVETISHVDAIWTLAKSALAVALIIVAARFMIPWIMEHIVHTRNRELFTFTALLIALGTAYFADRIGLSLALGALVAGIVISESQYSHQILAEVTPLRDALSSLFFVSIGMLVDPRIWIAEPLLSIGLIAGTIALKALVVIGIALLLGQGLRVAILAGLGLAQVGEFAFVLAQAGQGFGLLPGSMYQQFLSISVLTMALTPLGLQVSPVLANSAHRTIRRLRLGRSQRPVPAGQRGTAASTRPSPSSLTPGRSPLVPHP